jgi:CheY-like chemotaxis protein
VAHSAATALEVANQFIPSIVFLDIELPDMSGYEAALLLHQHPQLQHTRLIALTDSGVHPAREHARASGFERYLVKPLTPEAVREVLDTLSE